MDIKTLTFSGVPNVGCLYEIPGSTDICFKENECIRDELNKTKNLFEHVPKDQFLAARCRTNPFELTKRCFFQNRAALKLAELDAMFGRWITRPYEIKEALSKGERTVLRFGDICGGPGGFSEYLLTFGHWRCRGYGITLKSENNFDVNKFNSNVLLQCFKTLYGSDGTGNICKKDNILHFQESVKQDTKGHNLHVVVADGGFSVNGIENQQETLSHQLLLAQIIIALSTLRIKGVFVCKLFDCFTKFTVQCLWILHQHFNEFVIVKPNQSRPANSERYVICNGFIGCSQTFINELLHLLSGNRCTTNSSSSSSSSSTTITMTDVFLNYIKESNNTIAKSQITALLELNKCIKDPRNCSLTYEDQCIKRNECFQLWEIGTYVRYDALYGQYYKSSNDVWKAVEMYKTRQQQQQPQLNDVNNRLCIHAGYKNQSYGWRYISRLPMNKFNVCLPNDTILVYSDAEQMYIDVISLPGDVQLYGYRPINQRLELLNIFLIAIGLL